MAYVSLDLECDTDNFPFREIASDLFERLRTETTENGFINRAAYGPLETKALQIIDDAARDLGLHTERDAGANLVVTLDGIDADQPYMACGSHLDSVPHGGNFDGAAGVVAALLAMGSLRRENFKPRRSLKLFGLRGEESARFGRPYLGSSALLGLLTEDDLRSRSADSGRTMLEMMDEVGVAVDLVRDGQPLVDMADMACWLELHIEQGPILSARRVPVGIVTGIRGNYRHRVVECVGEAGHSGTVPRELRHDPIFATAELITRLDNHWRRLLEAGRDLVVTSGEFGTDPSEHAIAKIPGSVRFSFEVRSQNADTLEEFYGLFRHECLAIEHQSGVTFVFDRRIEVAPASMDDGWIKRLEAIAERLGAPFRHVASGAGHDAAIFANAGIPTAMIFVRNENGSHNPNESMELDDLIVGAKIMREAFKETLL
jgi:beta-ureidopropionase / N-carbamoyl-L-amino-acid hydrolase